jgi:hypothetical protein
MPAGAATIVQTVSFHFADHGTMYTLFNQLDPSQAPLNAIEWDVNTTGGQGFLVHNQTSSPIMVNLSGTVFLATDGGNVSFPYTTPVSVAPITPAFVSESVSFSGGRQSYGSPDLTSYYVGKGTFPPGVSLEITGTLDVPATIATVTPASMYPTVDGTETITYFAGSTFLVPAPPSVVIIGMGLAGVFALAQRGGCCGVGSRA